ncbi:hypothetical protein CYMTET_27276 [Cymbomonas tetramitiformis]|uniref:Uncharacterized protein n=1 Tax=Cymbomonas tetramitiformis TaxID=36881 RepID=A0AAE0FQQ4_9CHLO|nr:hypothetical protein CYMTET_27276 [Cymbomonas tetramitiformis]
MGDMITGIAYAIAADILFGSFGVPIKSPAVVAAKVDPIIFQFYKASACFLTSFLTLFYVDFKFTYWGIVGAAIWVVNGTLAIVAVQKAGLGVAQALWSGLSIFVSFVWGTVVFGEPVKHIGLCVVALLLMAIGMAGIGLAAAGRFKEPLGQDLEQTRRLIMDEDAGRGKYEVRNNNFRIGILCAVYVGFANGSFMMPLKYANKEVKGAEYLMSFGIGAMSMTLLLLGGYYVVNKMIGRPFPSFQTQVKQTIPTNPKLASDLSG